MSKNILIINEYAGSLEYGMTFRHYYLAKEFIKQGHDVTIATASYSHFLKNDVVQSSILSLKKYFFGIFLNSFVM